MEIIDISKFYQFESIPNPLIIASDIINFNHKNKNRDKYIEIDNCNQWFNDFHIKKPFQKFDEIITNYFKTGTNSEVSLQKNTNIKKVLNQSSIYLIIKTEKVNGSNFSFTILPISNFEDLSNSAINRLYLHRDGLFEINPNSSYNSTFQEKSTTNHRFYRLNELLTTQGVFDSELDTKTKDLTLETEEDLHMRKGLTNKIFGDDPKFYSMPNYEDLDYLPEIDPEPEQKNIDDKDSIWLQKYGIPKQDYEYNEAEMDNILFSNPTKYCMQTSNKIFPLFEDLNDAENFLITIFEDLLEPLKKKKISITKKNFFELTRKEQYTLLLPNSYVLNIENSRVLDTSNLEKFNKEQTGKNNFVNINSYKVDNFDQNAFLPTSNSFLLGQAINIGIIRIGLGDFLDLWFSLDSSQKESIPKIRGKILKYMKYSRSDSFKENLLFIPKLIGKNQEIFEPNYLNKFKYIKNYNKVFKNPKIKSTKFKFVYQLGKVMNLNDINSFLASDLKL